MDDAEFHAKFDFKNRRELDHAIDHWRKEGYEMRMHGDTLDVQVPKSARPFVKPVKKTGTGALEKQSQKSPRKIGILDGDALFPNI